MTVVWVGPQEIAHGTFVRHFNLSIDCSDLVECVQVGREATVKAENLVLDHRSKRQQIEQIGIVLPDVGIAVFTEALIIETVDLCNLARLVISTEDSDAVLEANLERHEQSHRLDRIVAAVHIVAHEEIVRVG